MSRACAVALAVACLLTPATATVASAAGDQPVEVSVDRAEVSTRLGDSFGFRSEVTNTGARALSGLVTHLNVVGLDPEIYVDPEDWSEERTKDVPDLRPGESAEISWSVKAVTGGHAAIYVVVLPGEPASAREGLAISPAIDVRIADTKDLNSGDVLPLALGVPALIGVATLVVRRRRTR